MFTITPHDLLFIIIFTLYGFGILCTVLGVSVLVSRAIGRDIKTLATQTAKLAQKGFAEDVAGLVGNASSLLDALNQLIKSTAGVGVFLILMGLSFFAVAALLTLRIFMS
jgi:hypothetical protein